MLFVDFGITGTLPMGDIYKLECRYKYSVEATLREPLSQVDIQAFTSIQVVHDKLFCIPPLAVRSELVRIKPFSAVEFVGNWMPQVRKFMTEYCTEHEFLFTGTVLVCVCVYCYIIFDMSFLSLFS